MYPDNLYSTFRDPMWRATYVHIALLLGGSLGSTVLLPGFWFRGDLINLQDNAATRDGRPSSNRTRSSQYSNIDGCPTIREDPQLDGCMQSVTLVALRLLPDAQ